jgi:hypothetical protein
VLEPGRRAVDDQVEVLGRDLVEVYRFHPELFGQFFGALVGPVRYCDPARADIEQCTDDAAYGATSSQDQHRAFVEVELQALAHVANETDAIGVVADDGVAVEDERVDGPGQACPRQQVIGELGRIDLERHSDVQPAIAGIAQRERALLETVERRLDALIGDLLVRLPREALVDLR